MVSISDNNRRIAKNTFFLYGQLVFSVLVGLYTSRIVLKTLGVDDFGIYNLVGGFVSLLTVFTFSISGTCQRFIVYELGKDDKKNLSETFCTISIVLSVFSTLFFLLAGSLGPLLIKSFLNIPCERTNAAIIVYYSSLSVFCFQLLAVPYSSLVVAHEKMGFYTIMNITETTGKLLVVVFLTFVNIDKLVFYAVMLAAISLIIRIIYSIYCNRKFEEAKFHLIFRKDIFKDITSFTFWVSFGSFAGILKDQGGSIIVNLFFGVTLNAAMGIASQVRNLVNQMSSNISLAISPQITKSYSSGNHARAIQLTFLLAKAQIYMMLFVGLPIIIETPSLLHLWLGVYPNYSVLFVRIIIVLSVAQALEISYGPLFLAIGKVKNFELMVSLVTLMVLPLTYICYLFHFHPASYYIVCIVFEIILFLYSYNWLRKSINFPMIIFLNEIVGRLIVVCIITICSVFVFRMATGNIDNYVLRMFSNMLLCIFILIITSYYLGINSEERNLVRKYIISKLTRHETSY